MHWVQDMTARWVRILSATGPESTPLDEAARQISEIGRVSNAPGRFGRPKRSAPATAETIPDRVLARQLIAGVLVSDFLVSQLCAATGQSREQLLGQLDGNLPPVRDRQLGALLLELSGSCALLQDPERPAYAALGGRIEQLLKNAEDQSVALIEAARAEAARIVSVPDRATCYSDANATWDDGRADRACCHHLLGLLATWGNFSRNLLLADVRASRH